jgi:hypothetical protein
MGGPPLLPRWVRVAALDRLHPRMRGLMRRDDFYPFFSRLLTVSVHEGNFMDPQVRMLLSCIWEAFEQGRPVPGPAGR